MSSSDQIELINIIQEMFGKKKRCLFYSDVIF